MTENREITTEEELRALPERSIVLDKENSPYQKHDDSPPWYGVFGNEEWEHEVLTLGPVTLIFEPKKPLKPLPTAENSFVSFFHTAQQETAYGIRVGGEWLDPQDYQPWDNGFIERQDFTVLHDAGKDA